VDFIVEGVGTVEGRKVVVTTGGGVVSIGVDDSGVEG